MRSVRLPAVLLAALLATGCAARPGTGPPRDPWDPTLLEGTWQGLGTNRLVFADGRWSLESDQIRYEGTYVVEGRELLLTTERVLPEAYRRLCRGATDEYRWALLEGRLTLIPTGEVCSMNLESVIRDADWRRG